VCSCLSFFRCYGSHLDLHSFPTRRSSDLSFICFLTARYTKKAPSRMIPKKVPPSPKNLKVRMRSSLAMRCSYCWYSAGWVARFRSEEHTSELQSRENLVCRLLLEKKKGTQ